MTVMEKYREWETSIPRNHAGHAFPTRSLEDIEALLPSSMNYTAETGCGKSTILFSNLSRKHFVFALNDLELESQSSVAFYRDCPITVQESLIEIFGPTQVTLPPYQHEYLYDCVLLDGPHGYPFPELEYYFFYSKIREGGFLIIDDVNIPTIGRMADILCEDQMWEYVALVSCTLILKRTSFPTFDPTGDNWWSQLYNRRRVGPKRDIYIAGDQPSEKITSLKLDESLWK